MDLVYITSCIIVWSGHTWLQKIAHRPRLGSGVEDVKAEKFCTPPWKQCQWWECGFIVPNYFLVFLIKRLQFLLRVITLLSWGKRTQLLPSCCLVVSVITWLHAWRIGSSFPNQQTFSHNMLMSHPCFSCFHPAWTARWIRMMACSHIHANMHNYIYDRYICMDVYMQCICVCF